MRQYLMLILQLHFESGIRQCLQYHAFYFIGILSFLVIRTIRSLITTSWSSLFTHTHIIVKNKEYFKRKNEFIEKFLPILSQKLFLIE